MGAYRALAYRGAIDADVEAQTDVADEFGIIAGAITRRPATDVRYCSMRMLLSRITWPQRAISLLRIERPAAGERSSFGKADTPSAAQVLRIAGSETISCSSEFSISITESGVPLGANNACQYWISNFGPNTCTKLSAAGSCDDFSFVVMP